MVRFQAFPISQGTWIFLVCKILPLVFLMLEVSTFFITPTKVSCVYCCLHKSWWFGGCGALYGVLWDILHIMGRQEGKRCQTNHKVFHFPRWFCICFSLFNIYIIYYIFVKYIYLSKQNVYTVFSCLVPLRAMISSKCRLASLFFETSIVKRGFVGSFLVILIAM